MHPNPRTIQGGYVVGKEKIKKETSLVVSTSVLRYFATPDYSSTMKKLKAGLHLRLRHQQNKHTQKHLYC